MMIRGRKVVDAIIIVLLINFVVLTITYIWLIRDMPRIYALVPPQVLKVSVADEKIEKPQKGFVIVNDNGTASFVPYYVEGIIV